MREVLYGVLHHEPAPLTGSALVEALNVVIRRALDKNREGRWPSAAAMETALASAENARSAAGEERPRAVRRLIVLPFRLLRKDDEAGFLAYSLPHAITNSLAGLDSLIIRSSNVAGRFAADADPKSIAKEAQVDTVLTGSLLRHGAKIRVTCQLADAPGGAVLWSHTSEISMEDLFSLQDDLANRIAGSLLPSITEKDRKQFDRDVPRSPAAYEYFLRANQLTWMRGLDNARLARDLYRECLALDPQYAPAWAGLGRILRFILKFGSDGEETLESVDAAFRHAFRLNRDLALAHNYYTPTQCDLGFAPDAMVRLLKRARSRHNDADLFAGLVHACRYSGELEASITAHERVRLLDPHVATSVAHTYFIRGDYEKTLECYARGTSYYLDCAVLACMGREEEALARLLQREKTLAATGLVFPIMGSLRALLQGDLSGCVRLAEENMVRARRDPESLYYAARHLARSGKGAAALHLMTDVVNGGFLCEAPLERDPWLATVRTTPGFGDLLHRVQERRKEVRARFVAAGALEVL